MPNLLATLGQQYEIIAGTGIAESQRVTFDGVSYGAVNTFTIFTVSGLVGIKLYAICEVDLVSGGGGSLSVGTATTVAGIVPVTTATSIDAHEVWYDGTPAAPGLTSGIVEKITDENIICSTTTATITAGRIRFLAIWRPLSPGATVTAISPGISLSASPSPSASQSPSASASPSASPSTSVSPSGSQSPSASLSPSASASRSSSASQSPSASLSPSASRSPSSSVSPSASISPSVSPSASISPSASVSPSSSASISPSISPSSSQSPSASRSPSSSISPSPSPSA